MSINIDTAIKEINNEILSLGDLSSVSAEILDSYQKRIHELLSQISLSDEEFNRKIKTFS